jgi:hypothetical protein
MRKKQDRSKYHQVQLRVNRELLGVMDEVVARQRELERARGIVPRATRTALIMEAISSWVGVLNPGDDEDLVVAPEMP